MRRRKNEGKRSWGVKICIFLGCLACFLNSTKTGWAGNKDFTEGYGTIQDNEVYDYVSAFHDATVDMMGGNIINVFTAYNSSTVNISGGDVNILQSYEFSSLNLMGSATIDWIKVNNSSILNMNGGTIGGMIVNTSGGAYLYNGIISDGLAASYTVNIYGYGFSYNPDAGAYEGGQLTGFWGNGLPFSIDLVSYEGNPGSTPIDTWPQISLHEIPEPCTLALLVLGAIIFPKRK